MSELKVSPLLDAMEVGECFAKHDGVSCYNIRHPESGREFVLKHISVPATQDQVEALLLTGAYADKEEADGYYRKEAEALIREAEERKKLLDCPYILPFLGVQMEKKQEGVGYDVYAVLPKRNSLQKYLEENAISHLRGINMGIDLCVALAALREEGYVHGNLKPGNVFFSDSGRFLLGDFGLISTQDMQYAVLPEQYRSSYTAPELRNFIGGLNTTVDIYSLGMILYRIYNGNHAPFEDEQTPSKAADTRRLEGDTLPAPLYADYELAEIIQKACAYDPADRYQTPDQMRVVLEQYMRRNAVSDHLIVPPLVADEGPLSAEDREEAIEPVRANDVTKMDDTFKKAFAPNEKKSKGKKNEPEKPAAPAPEEQTPLLTAERRRAAEKARKRRRRRRRAWIVFGLLMVLLIVGIGLYEFTPLGEGLYHYFVTVEKLEVSDVSVDAITLDLKASVSEEKFTAHCEDAFGNAFQSDFKDGKATFTGLNPGTQYTLRVTMSGRHKISGKTSVITTTLPQAEVLSFSASAGSQEGAVQLSLLVKDENVVPSEWLLRYGKAGEEEQELTFSGFNVTVTGLEGGSEYTFRLVETDELPLDGALETSFTAPREILAQELRLDDVIDGTALVSWVCTTEPPADWEIACADDNDQAMEIEIHTPVQEGDSWHCSASVLDVAPDMSYTLKLNAPDCIFQPMTLKFIGNLVKVDSLVLDSIQDGSAYISWNCSTDLPEQWILTCSDPAEQTIPVEVFDDQMQEMGYFCSAVVRNVVPGTPYTVELFAVGMPEPLTVEFLDPAFYVENFTAALNEDGEITVSWEADREPADGWTVTVEYGADLETVLEVSGTSCSLSAVPQTAYSFTLAAADGTEIRGVTTASLTTPAAERFTDLGIRATGTTIGTYYTPTKEDWTERDLGGGTVRFKTDDSITFRIAVTADPDESDVEVTVQYVIRDGSDRLVHVEEENVSWSSLWDGRQWMDQIPWLPEEPGSYSFTVLVNGKRMGTINFSIVN